MQSALLRTGKVTILPGVPHNLSTFVNLSGTPGSTILTASLCASTVGGTLVREGEDAGLSSHTQALFWSVPLSKASFSAPEFAISDRELNIVVAVLSGVAGVLEVLKEAPSLFELLNTMVGKRFDAASSWVPVETFRHWTGDTLAALHLRSRLANGTERSRLLACLRWNIVQDHSKGTLRNPAEKPRSLGSVDALSLDVEEESLVALKVGARATFLAVLPRVPHHLPVLVNLSCAPGGSIFGSSVGALVVSHSLIAEWKDTILLGVGLALTLPQATQVTSTGSRGLERSTTLLSEVLGTGEAAATLVQGVHPRWAAYWGLAREGATGAGEGEGDRDASGKDSEPKHDVAY